LGSAPRDATKPAPGTSGPDAGLRRLASPAEPSGRPGRALRALRPGHVECPGAAAVVVCRPTDRRKRARFFMSVCGTYVSLGLRPCHYPRLQAIRGLTGTTTYGRTLPPAPPSPGNPTFRTPGAGRLWKPPPSQTLALTLRIGRPNRFSSLGQGQAWAGTRPAMVRE
jgi:hypothetical protein